MDALLHDVLARYSGELSGPTVIEHVREVGENASFHKPMISVVVR